MLLMWFHYNVSGQHSVIITALNLILHQKSTICCFVKHTVLSLEADYFNYDQVICCISVAIGFLLCPIISLLMLPEQMFSNLLLTKQANSGCY